MAYNPHPHPNVAIPNDPRRHSSLTSHEIWYPNGYAQQPQNLANSNPSPHRPLTGYATPPRSTPASSSAPYSYATQPQRYSSIYLSPQDQPGDIWPPMPNYSTPVQPQPQYYHQQQFAYNPQTDRAASSSTGNLDYYYNPHTDANHDLDNEYSYDRDNDPSNPAYSRYYTQDPPESWQMPEPQITRSVSQQSARRPTYGSPQGQTHRYYNSDVGPELQLQRQASRASSYALSGEGEPEELWEDESEELAKAVSSMTLEEDGLRRFQAGELNPADEEWHKLVPESVRDSFGKNEVQRQSVIFEVIKSEKDYVGDLEALRDVFIHPLSISSVIPEGRRDGFIKEIYYNLDEIIAAHQHMLAELFDRQREQHPIIQSVSDIILDTILRCQFDYEHYIKHYPLAEAIHRKELQKNTAYAKLIQERTHDPRIRKRDLITFISRPVTRLPRLSLLLEHIEKLTNEEDHPNHPDRESLPLILSILHDVVKGTQPGIEAAEGKVKFWSLCESLVYKKGEIIDMDLYDDSRTLVYMGPLARRQRSELDWHGWNDYTVALLDNYLLITREEKKANNTSKYLIVSRPIPLQFLRLAQFSEPSESRKEKTEEGNILEKMFFHYKPYYPFTIYHLADRANRRYTLYAASEAIRKKWENMLLETLGLFRVRQEANLWFASQKLNDTFFRVRLAVNSAPVSAQEKKNPFTGQITAAAAFMSGGRNYLAVGCGTGIFVGFRGESNFAKVLNIPNPFSIVALPEHNKFIVHFDSGLLSWSLDILARVSQKNSTPQALDASLERIAGLNGSVVSFRAGKVANRTMVVYTNKGFRQMTVHALEVLLPGQATAMVRRDTGSTHSFRSFGEPFYVPRHAYDITLLTKSVAIATDRGIINVDPTNLSSAAILFVPDFSEAPEDAKIAALKARSDSTRPLGTVRSDRDEILIVYVDFGCYVTRLGKPCRSANIIRWETKAQTYAHRNNHILLFSSDFIEIRHVQTGRLVQVIEGKDIRLLHSGPPAEGPVLVAMRGNKGDKASANDELLQLVETADLATPMATSTSEALWEEWDM